MTRTDIIELIINCKTILPYNKTDLIDRVGTKRPISDGQNRVLCQIINDVSKLKGEAVNVNTDHWSDEYLSINFDTNGKSLQSLGHGLKPVIKHNQSLHGITNKNNATIITHEKGNLICGCN